MTDDLGTSSTMFKRIKHKVLVRDFRERLRLRKEAEQLLADETDGYVAAAIANPEAPVDDARLKRIAALRETVAGLPRSAAPERVFALCLVAVSILAAIVVWLWRMSTVDFAADITARQAAIRNTANVLANAAIRGKSVHFENGANILGFNLPPAPPGEPRDIAGPVWLKNFHTEGKGMTEIRPTEDGLDITVSDGLIRGTLLRRPDPSAPFDSAEFEAVGTPGKPAIVHVTSASVDPIDVAGSAQSTDFLLAEQAIEGNAPMFRSTITGGTITIPVGNRKLTLHPGDVILMRGIRLRWLELTVDKAVHLNIEGRGAELRTGPQNAIEDLRPTALQTMQEDKWKLLWGAILFICGMLWNGRKFVAGGSAS